MTEITASLLSVWLMNNSDSANDNLGVNESESLSLAA